MMRDELMFTVKMVLVLLVTAVLSWLLFGCAATPKPKPEYEYEFVLEINGQVVQRQTGRVREVEPKE